MVMFLASLLLWAHGTGAVLMFPKPLILTEVGADQSLSSRLFRVGHESGYTPEFNVFKHKFTTFDSFVTAQAPEIPRAGNVKLLIGVQALASDSVYRQVHRETWITRKGCGVDLSHDIVPPTGDCHFYYTFVLGKSRISSEDKQVQHEMAKKGDITVPFFPASQTRFDKTHEQCFMADAANTTYTITDPILPKDGNLEDKDGWVNVKNQGWMHFATDHYRWASHIVVMDLDTYPIVEKVLNDIRDPENSSWAHKEIKPKGWSEKKGGMYYGAKCSNLKGKAQGAFVGFSRSTLECMCNRKDLKFNFIPYIQKHADANMAQIVRKAMAEGCPETWFVGPASCDGDSQPRWEHNWQWKIWDFVPSLR